MYAANREGEIISSCQSGRSADFCYLYDIYAKNIYRFIYYRTLHKETAEDLTSETFLKALDKIKDFDRKKGSFSSWLYQIARNKIIDYYRTRKPYFSVDDAWDVKDDFDIEKDIEAKEKIEKIKQYLQKLKPEQREIIILRVWQDLPYKEISEILGKSEAASKMAFSRAMKALQEIMPRFMLLIFILSVLHYVEDIRKII